MRNSEVISIGDVTKSACESIETSDRQSAPKITFRSKRNRPALRCRHQPIRIWQASEFALEYLEDIIMSTYWTMYVWMLYEYSILTSSRVDVSVEVVVRVARHC